MIEYLYECPKCGKKFWDSLYYNPICIHDGSVGYETKEVYHPCDPEEPSALRVVREIDEEEMEGAS